MDAALVWDNSRFGADLAVADGDLAADGGLRTAVILSLFTDARARSDDDPSGDPSDRRGWWGDVYPEVEGDAIGSRLWLLAREKQTADVLPRARGYAEEALAWMVEDGVAAAVAVDASFPAAGVLSLEVAITRPDGTVFAERFDTLWGAV